MRKIKIQVQMSVDGYIAGPSGETDWMNRNWDIELKKYVYNLTRPVDCIILGRNLAAGFIETWQNKASDTNTTDAYAHKMVETPKIVFSRTLESNPWKNTRLAKGELPEELGRLKQLKGRDIIAYGGVSFLTSLIRTGLVDEYNFFVNPVVLGKGKSIFRDIEEVLKLDLVYSTSFECGITALCYIPHRRAEHNKNIQVTTNSEVK